MNQTFRLGYAASYVVGVFLGLTLASTCVWADDLSSVSQSVVRIGVVGEAVNGAHGPFWGTGFFVSAEGHIITARHTLQCGENCYDHWLPNQDGTHRRRIEVWWNDPISGNLIPSPVLAQFNETDQIAGTDVVLLKIPGTGFKEVSCSRSEPVLEDKEYWRFGYSDIDTIPYLQPRHGKRLRTPDAEVPRYTFGVESKKGMSGGPIVDRRGLVRGYITSGRDGRIENVTSTYAFPISRAELLLPNISLCKRRLGDELGNDEAIESKTEWTTLLHIGEMHFMREGKSTKYRSVYVFANLTDSPLTNIDFGTGINTGAFRSYRVDARKVLLRDHRTASHELSERIHLEAENASKSFERLYGRYGDLGEEIGQITEERGKVTSSRGDGVVRLLSGNQPRIEGITNGISPIQYSPKKDEVVVVRIEYEADQGQKPKAGDLGLRHSYDTQRCLLIATSDGSFSFNARTVSKRFHGPSPTMKPENPLLSKSSKGVVLDVINVPKQFKAKLTWAWGDH